MRKTNMLLMSDYYKQSHAMMYPDGVSYLATYFTPRMSRMPHYQDFLICFGVQGFCEDYLIERFNETFFNRDKAEVVEEARFILKETLNPNYDFIDKIGALHDLGYLPIRVSALPEGTKCPVYKKEQYGEGKENPVKVPMVKVENTHPDFAWLAEWIESIMSCQLWYPMTVANQAYYYREIADEAYNKSCSSNVSARSAISEFGFRGQDGSEGAIMASSAFLTSFNKTATIPAILYLRDYYGGKIESGDTGAGMISTEHSVMCSNYAVDGDEETFLIKLFKEVCPYGALSVVADSYDYWENIKRICNGAVKEAIMNREGTVFVRGDSGDPVDIICGTQEFLVGDSFLELQDKCAEFEIYNPYDVTDYYCKVLGKNGWEYGVITVEADGNYRASKVSMKQYNPKLHEIGTVEALFNGFGGKKNKKGYIVLDDHIRAIYGDSITPNRARLIYERLMNKGYAANNVALGAGSFSMRCAEENGSLLPFTRDSYGIAIKATYMETKDGREHQIFKNPKTDTGMFKKSQKGLVWVGEAKDGIIYAKDGFTRKTMPDGCLLRTVFEDGKMINVETINEIRNRLHDGEF